MTYRWLDRRIIGVTMLVCATTTVHAQQTVAVEGRAATTMYAELLTRPVTIRLDDVPLRQAVAQLGHAARVQFQYRSQLLDSTGMRVSVKAAQRPLGDVLGEMLRGTHLRAVPVTPEIISIESVGRNAREGRGDITGRVTDADTKAPIAGATITLDGRKLVARTDEHGAFRIANVSVGTYTAVVRRIGYSVMRQSVSVAEDGAAKVEIALRATITALEQVVTTVTGPQRRVELGNAIAVVKADSLVKEAPVTTLTELLTARVPGMIVMQGQGVVGGDVQLRIRGMTSLQGGANPIVIVDGVRYRSEGGGSFTGNPRSPLNDLNPNDVETVEVVKGPSAATLYGTDASNGVIVITTKRGKVGPPRWALFGRGMTDEIPVDRQGKVYRGWGQRPDNDVGAWCDIGAIADGSCTHQDSVTIKDVSNGGNVSMFKPAQSWTTGASVSGGQAALRYYFGGNYDNQIGAVGLPDTVVTLVKARQGVTKLPRSLLRPNTNTLLDLRSNVTASLTPKLDVTVNGGYSRAHTQGLRSAFPPYQMGATDPTSDFLIDYLSSFFAEKYTEESTRFVTSANAVGQWTPWLTTRATVGVDATNQIAQSLLLPDSSRWINSPEGYAGDMRGPRSTMTADGGVTVMLRQGPLSFRTSAGAQYVRSLVDQYRIDGQNLPPGATTVERAATKFYSQTYSNTVTLGTYAEETIGWQDRVFVTGALRVDGASTFGSGYDAAIYPKLSASWLVSQEPWAARIPGLSDLRLRAAMGVSGKQPDPTWAQPRYFLTTVRTSPSTSVSIPAVQSTGNPFLRPERSREFERGLDAAFLDRRFQVEATWYSRRTSDQFINQAMPAGLGYQMRNVGLTTEHGFEEQLTATLLDLQPISWTVALSHATHATKLVNLGGATPDYNSWGGLVEGYPLGARFVVPIKSFTDANGDRVISESEVTLGDTAEYVGESATPRTQTMTSTVGLLQNRVRVSALFERQAGLTLINDAFGCNWCRERIDVTTPLALQAAVRARDIFTPGYAGYRYVETGSFTRLREVNIAVTIPARFARAFRANSGSVTLSGRNLGLWTNFSGAEPEGGELTNQIIRLPTLGIPQSRTWVLRCDLDL